MDGTQIPVAMTLREAIVRYNALCKDANEFKDIKKRLTDKMEAIKDGQEACLMLTLTEMETLRKAVMFAQSRVEKELEQKFYVQREDENG